MSKLGATATDQIVVTKWVGLTGTEALVKAKYEEIHGRYASDFLAPVFQFSSLFSYEKEYSVIEEFPVNATVEAGFGGIFGALFQLGYDSDLGIMVDLMKLPILQETIETAEFFQLNPYLLHSGGSMVIATRDGERLVWQLKKCDVEAQVVGHMTKEKARIVYLEEESKSLIPPRKDELFKVLPQESYKDIFPKKIIEK